MSFPVYSDVIYIDRVYHRPITMAGGVKIKCNKYSLYEANKHYNNHIHSMVGPDALAQAVADIINEPLWARLVV